MALYPWMYLCPSRWIFKDTYTHSYFYWLNEKETIVHKGNVNTMSCWWGYVKEICIGTIVIPSRIPVELVVRVWAYWLGLQLPTCPLAFLGVPSSLSTRKGWLNSPWVLAAPHQISLQCSEEILGVSLLVWISFKKVRDLHGLRKPLEFPVGRWATLSAHIAT